MSVADQFDLAGDPRRVCLIQAGLDEVRDADRICGLIVAVRRVESDKLVLGAGDTPALDTAFSWKTGAASGGARLSAFAVPQSELDRIEDFAVQGEYGDDDGID